MFPHKCFPNETSLRKVKIMNRPSNSQNGHAPSGNMSKVVKVWVLFIGDIVSSRKYQFREFSFGKLFIRQIVFRGICLDPIVTGAGSYNTSYTTVTLEPESSRMLMNEKS